MSDSIYTTGEYWAKNAHYHLEDSAWKARQLAELISQGDGMVHGAGRRLAVAEIGCGAGGVLNAFVSILRDSGYPCQGTGYDISVQAIEKARSLFPSCEFVVGDLTEMPVKYDLLLICDVLEHVPDPREMLIRCLDRSSAVLIHLPLDDYLWGRMLRGWQGHFDYVRDAWGHIHYFTKRTGLALVDSAGGQVVDWRYTKWGLEQDFDTSRSGRVARVLRECGFRINMDISARLLGGVSIGMLCMKGSRVLRPA